MAKLYWSPDLRESAWTDGRLRKENPQPLFQQFWNKSNCKRLIHEDVPGLTIFWDLTCDIQLLILDGHSHAGGHVQKHRGKFPHDLFQLRIAGPQCLSLGVAAGKTSRNSRF